MSGEHELPTASVVLCVASAARPPPWTTLHQYQTRSAPLIELNSVFGQPEPPLTQVNVDLFAFGVAPLRIIREKEARHLV